MRPVSNNEFCSTYNTCATGHLGSTSTFSRAPCPQFWSGRVPENRSPSLGFVHQVGTAELDDGPRGRARNGASQDARAEHDARADPDGSRDAERTKGILAQLCAQIGRKPGEEAR